MSLVKIVLALLIMTGIAQAGEEIGEIVIRDHRVTDEVIDLKRRMELSRGTAVVNGAELIEIILVNARSTSGTTRVTLNAGFTQEITVTSRQKDWVISTTTTQGELSVGKVWALGIRGRLEVDSILVVYDNPNCRINCGSPSELALIRYEKTQGDDDLRVTTHEVVDPKYFEDRVIGYILPPSTRESSVTGVYECFSSGRDFFLSVNRNCEGQRRLGLLGYLYSAPVAGTAPLYRCYDGFTHSASTQSNCEGMGNAEGVLGYILK